MKPSTEPTESTKPPAEDTPVDSVDSVDAFLEELKQGGFSVRLDNGRLVISPWSKLSSEQKGRIARRGREIVRLLGTNSDVIDAIAERAWFDEPAWGEHHTCLRESVIVRIEGMPVMALSPAFVEAVLTHNKAAQERHDREQRKTQTTSKKKARQSGLLERTEDATEEGL